MPIMTCAVCEKEHETGGYFVAQHGLMISFCSAECAMTWMRGQEPSKQAESLASTALEVCRDKRDALVEGAETALKYAQKAIKALTAHQVQDSARHMQAVVTILEDSTRTG